MTGRAQRHVGLADRLEAVDEALELAEARADAGLIAEARSVRSRVDERLARGEQLVVAAFAGGTGTGKSSLFNAVAGERIAETGVRRPTTDEPQALVAGALTAANPLLDWLGIRRRHVADFDGLPEGLVLVDLPDHDSVAVEHHATSARLTERVDLVVWVVDPLKYSRSDLHHGALRALGEHAEVLVVVMNHTDALSSDDRRACADDLGGLLDAAGLGGARLLLTSARTGEGVGALRELIVEEARRRHAVAARVAADLRAVAKRLRDGALGGATPRPDALDLGEVVDALAAAGGVEGRAEAAAAEYRRTALAATTPLLSAVLAVLASLARRAVTGARALLERPGGARVDEAGAAPVAVAHALRGLVDRVGGGLPAAARAPLLDALAPDDLGRAVTRSVDAVSLRPGRLRWWTAARVLLTLCELSALAGFGWLLLAWALDWLRLPELWMPRLAGELAWPTALLLGGLLARVLGGLARRRAARAGGARHGAAVRARLRRAVERAAEEHVGAPVRAELARLERLDTALAKAAS